MTFGLLIFVVVIFLLSSPSSIQTKSTRLQLPQDAPFRRLQVIVAGGEERAGVVRAPRGDETTRAARRLKRIGRTFAVTMVRHASERVWEHDEGRNTTTQANTSVNIPVIFCSKDHLFHRNNTQQLLVVREKLLLGQLPRPLSGPKPSMKRTYRYAASHLLFTPCALSISTPCRPDRGNV